MTGDALFEDEGFRTQAPPEVDDRTAGQKLRDRQQSRIGAGLHPLSMHGARIPLHDDAPRDARKDDGRDYPRCGGCAHRQMVGGHASDFPKCLVGYWRRELTDGERAALRGTFRESATHTTYMGPRYSMSAASDVKAWWPACKDWQAAS